jgi:hypothetical protein
VNVAREPVEFSDEQLGTFASGLLQGAREFRALAFVGACFDFGV